MGGGTLLDWIKILFLISGTPNWFMRTYLFLFLFSPVINSFIKDCSLRRRVFLLLVLFFISHYVGILGFDSSLSDGKNLVTFVFFYVIGDTIHVYKDKWMKIPGCFFWIIYCCYNLFLLCVFTFLEYGILNSLFYRVFYSYHSIGLLLNTVLLMMAVGHYNFHSPSINRMARASIAMYLLQPYYFLFVIPSSITILYSLSQMNFIPLTFLLMLFTALLVIISWSIYEILTPIWKLLYRSGNWCQNFADSFCQKYLNK